MAGEKQNGVNREFPAREDVSSGMARAGLCKHTSRTAERELMKLSSRLPGAISYAHQMFSVVMRLVSLMGSPACYCSTNTVVAQVVALVYLPSTM